MSRFVYFRSFRLSTGQQYGRHRQIHWAMAAPHSKFNRAIYYVTKKDNILLSSLKFIGMVVQLNLKNLIN